MDANMARWAAVPDLRAMGFLGNDGIAFPFNNSPDRHMCSDSLGVFIIGNHGPIRMAYGPEAFDYKVGPTAQFKRQPNANRPVLRHLVFDKMHHAEEPFQNYQFGGRRRCPGYPMSSFIPRTKPVLKQIFVVSSLAPVDQWHERPHQDIQE